jgi:hypothetical protein
MNKVIAGINGFCPDTPLNAYGKTQGIDVYRKGAER